MWKELITFFVEHPNVSLITIGIFSLMIGSFLNVVIYRLPIIMKNNWHEECHEFLSTEPAPTQKGLSLALPNSHCANCKHPIKVLDNIPIFSYLFLKGKCRHCKTKISIQYPMVEFLTLMLSLLVAWHFGLTLQMILVLLITWYLIAITFIDIEHTIIPDNLTMPLLWGGLILNTWLGVFTTAQMAVMGAVVGYLSLWGFYHGFKLVTGKEGMGFGDFKLLAMFGAWLGVHMLPLIIFLSAVIGSIIGISQIIFSGKNKSTPIPFGPYLSLAGFVAFLWGDKINAMYLQWAGYL